MDNDINRKIDFVDQYVDGLAKRLADDNKYLEESLKAELKKNLKNNLKSGDETVLVLLKILSEGGLTVNTEKKLEVEQAIEELSQWAERNNEAVLAYKQEINLNKNSTGEVFKDNFDTSDKEVTTRTLADSLNKVYDNSEYQLAEGLEEIDTGSEAVSLSKQIPKQLNEATYNHQKIANGITSGPQNLVTKGTNFLKKSIDNGLSKAGIGAKKFLANNFGKIGGSVVKGLNTAVALPTKLVGSLGVKMIGPILIGFFIVFFVVTIITSNGKASGLVPRLETDGENGNESAPLLHGEITYMEDGRIKDCGVGMEVNFKRNKEFTMVTPQLLTNTLEDYNKQLEEFVGSEYGNRCGVVYAGQYLAYEFEYWVPYSWGGYDGKGLHPKWGSSYDDGHGHIYLGIDCAAFRDWVQINGRGSIGTKQEYPINPNFCNNIKNMIEPGDGLVIRNEDGYHFALIVAYEGETVKFAHSGGGSGVTTGLVNICTGRGIDNGMQFNIFQKKYY